MCVKYSIKVSFVVLSYITKKNDGHEILASLGSRQDRHNGN